MKNLVIPKQEKRNRYLTLPVTPTEHEQILSFCREKKVKFTDLMRHALKEMYELI